jgi:hypothetical protein
MFELELMKIKVVMKSFFAHICPFIAAALAFVGNPEVFNALKRRAASTILPLNLVGVPKLFPLNLFRLEHAFA